LVVGVRRRALFSFSLLLACKYEKEKGLCKPNLRFV
jgi:hypothetical protein